MSENESQACENENQARLCYYICSLACRSICKLHILHAQNLNPTLAERFVNVSNM